MELQDYGVALRRYWTTWVGVALAGLLVALAVVLVTPPTYQATAQVFVAGVDGSTSSSQFVNQRVSSYPEVAASRTVLAPVIEELGLTESFSNLRERVVATNPVDTSQIEIAVTDRDASRAAEIADAVAERFGTAVERLEQPGSGASPVSLSVTTPATVPTTPISPVPALVLPLGLVVGLVLGAAVAIARSRMDTRLHTADDVRAAWGSGSDQLVVHAAPARRTRRARSARRSTTLLARQLEPMAEQAHVRVVAVSPAPDSRSAVESVVHQVADDLMAWQVPVHVASSSTGVAPDRPGVQLQVGSPLASPRQWRELARAGVGAVLVVVPGRTDRDDLQEMRSILDAATVPVLAVVLARHQHRRAGDAGRPQPTVAAPEDVVLSAPASQRPVPAGRD